MAYEKHTWVNNETITAAKMNNIEDGIEEAAQSGGSRYDAYDYVLGANGSTPPDIIKGTFAEIYEKLEAGEDVVGLFKETFTDVNGNMTAIFVPIFRTYYYSSAGSLFLYPSYWNGSIWVQPTFEWFNDDTIDFA